MSTSAVMACLPIIKARMMTTMRSALVDESEVFGSLVEVAQAKSSLSRS